MHRYRYKITVHEGYHWNDKDLIFRDYGDTLYNMRLTYAKSDPKNLICKLLMNSLYAGGYGIFGLVLGWRSIALKRLSPKFQITY